MANKKQHQEQCIISFASKGREDYNKAQARCARSLRAAGYQDDLLFYSLDDPRKVDNDVINGGLPNNCPSHAEVPYGFKPYLFKEAYDKGYRRIIWTDSTIVAARNPQPVFEEATKRGVVGFHNVGHNLKLWIGENAVKTTGIDLNENPYQLMACVLAFDLNHPRGKRIFDKWLELSKDGLSFQNSSSLVPGFRAHRHDQAVLSALMWKEKVKLLPYGALVYEPHDETKEFGKDYYFVNKGIK